LAFYISVPDKSDANKMVSILEEHLELESLPLESNKVMPNMDSRTVFIVHGHDNGLKQEVARVLEKLDLEPKILHEQANEGMTIIEKLEKHSKQINVGYVVALLTPDDLGAEEAKVNQLCYRARQNVVFELGYFIALLGRSRVCALYKEKVELPTDYTGVSYIPVDNGGAWKYRIAQEIDNIGIKVDLNKIKGM